MHNGTAKDAAVETLKLVCTALCNQPDQLGIVVEYSGESASCIAIRCSSSDRGRLIGSKGEHFRALRTITAAIGATRRHEVKLREVLPAPGPAIQRRLPPYRFNPKWPQASVMSVLRYTCEAIFNCECEVLVQQLATSAILLVYPSKVPSLELHGLVLEPVGKIFAAIGLSHGCELLVDIKSY